MKTRYSKIQSVMMWMMDVTEIKEPNDYEDLLHELE